MYILICILGIIGIVLNWSEVVEWITSHRMALVHLFTKIKLKAIKLLYELGVL